MPAAVKPRAAPKETPPRANAVAAGAAAAAKEAAAPSKGAAVARKGAAVARKGAEVGRKGTDVARKRADGTAKRVAAATKRPPVAAAKGPAAASKDVAPAAPAAKSPQAPLPALAPAKRSSLPPSNYKVSVHVAATAQSAYYRLRATLDTGAGSNFIRTSNVPRGAKMKATGGRWRFIDANGRPLHVAGLTTLMTRLGELVAPVEYLAVDSLAASMILGCAFIDTHVRSIRPQSKLVTFVHGVSVPIRASSLIGSSVGSCPLPAGEDPRIRIRRWMVLHPGRTLLVKVRSMVTGLAFLRPLIEKNHPVARVHFHNHVEHVRAGQDFDVKVSNPTDKPINLSKDLVVGWAQRMIVR